MERQREGEGIWWRCGQGGWATTSRPKRRSLLGRWTARGRRGGEGRDAIEQGILGGRRVDNGEQGGEGAPAAEVGLETGGLAATVLPVRKTMTSMAMIDGGGGSWCFTPSMSFSVCRRCRDGDSKSVTASESRDCTPQSILEPPLRITMEGGREDFSDDGDGAGKPWRGFPLRDEDGDDEQGGDLGRRGDREQGGDLGQVDDGEESTSESVEQCARRRSRVGGVGEESTGGRHRAGKQGILGTGEMSVGSSELGVSIGGWMGGRKREEREGLGGGGGVERGGSGN